jgi:hypothetical protein
MEEANGALRLEKEMQLLELPLKTLQRMANGALRLEKEMQDDVVAAGLRKPERLAGGDRFHGEVSGCRLQDRAGRQSEGDPQGAKVPGKVL